MYILSPKVMDYFTADWNYIPAAGEVIIIKNPEVDMEYMHIGNGKDKIGDLAYITKDMVMEDKTCAQCRHLCVINRNKIYAVCDETGKVFELWHMDTRESDACKKFIKKNEHENKFRF